MATARPLDDDTECPICTEVYTDPRILPCVHMFCFKCIERWSKYKKPGHQVACPLCREKFTVPSNGLVNLPKRIFVSKPSVESKTSPCEACSGGEESEYEVQNVASVYCVECQMKFCRQCERETQGD